MMKKLLLFALAALTFASCSDDNEAPARTYDKITFEPSTLLGPDNKAVRPGRVTIEGFNPATFSDVFCGKSYLSRQDVTGNYFDGILFSAADGKIRFGSYFADMSKDEYGSYDTWGGFALSQNYCMTSSATGPDYATAQFSAWTAGGVNGSKTFALAYCNEPNQYQLAQYDYQMPKIEFSEPRTVAYLQVANATLTAQYIPTVADFWFKVIVTGYRGGVKGKSVEQVLIGGGKTLSAWSKVDCSALGEVDELRFSTDTNDRNDYGALAPSYFCLGELALEKIPATNTGK